MGKKEVVSIFATAFPWAVRAVCLSGTGLFQIIGLSLNLGIFSQKLYIYANTNTYICNYIKHVWDRRHFPSSHTIHKNHKEEKPIKGTTNPLHYSLLLSKHQINDNFLTNTFLLLQNGWVLFFLFCLCTPPPK